MSEVIVHDIAGNFEEQRQQEIGRIKAGVMSMAATRKTVEIVEIPEQVVSGIPYGGQDDGYKRSVTSHDTDPFWEMGLI